MENLRIGQMLKDEFGYPCTVVFIYENSFEVQFKSKACRTYRQSDIDNGTITFPNDKTSEKKNNAMPNIRIGQMLKSEFGHVCEVVFIHQDSFEVQFISGACRVYRQSDIDSGEITFYIG